MRSPAPELVGLIALALLASAPGARAQHERGQASASAPGARAQHERGQASARGAQGGEPERGTEPGAQGGTEQGARSDRGTEQDSEAGTRTEPAALAEREQVSSDHDVAISDAQPPPFRATARAGGPEDLDRAGRAVTETSREQMDERLARSAPDALRYVPGVSVQQTTHGQASPYVRGVTGQQVVTIFDGIRLNNGTYRQGPNQYFFTVDALSLDHLEVVRGSASTRWGSDAIGGAILAVPFEPRLDPGLDGVRFRARAIGRFASQDLDLEGRGELQAWLGPDIAVLAGAGYRAAQQLEAAGPIRNPADGALTLVPAFAPDGRHQLGTGFSTLTFDARLIARIAPRLRLVGALYGFRQFDTPRADQCPPPGGSARDCLRFEEQFRTLAYLAIRGEAGELRDIDVSLSYQRQHELRTFTESIAFSRYGYRDDVDTFGVAARAGSRRIPLLGDLAIRARGGGEIYLDRLESEAWAEFTDVAIVVPLSRGQYSDDARYGQGGLFGEIEIDLADRVRARGGARLGFAAARAPSESESRTAAIRADWAAAVGRVGIEGAPIEGFSLHANLEQGYRAPNLDDLTARQIVGPGFQFENPAIRPEQSTTIEIGSRLRHAIVQFDAWLFAIAIEGAITRAPRGLGDCPPETPACGGSWFRYQLVNVPGTSWILGSELAARIDTDIGLGGTITLAGAWGEGPNPVPRPIDPSVPYDERVPLSRIPPLGGTAELRWAHPETRLVIGAALRWAAPQDRLAPSDRGDARIPLGGTPAWAVFDLRAGWRWEDHLQIQVAFENVFDQAYRVHGSGVNGPGRGVALMLSGAL